MASATDIITYVGVPLAVFGVLPTIYTCLKSLLTLRSIRKILDQNGVQAITRSTLLSGIIEIEVPRKSITPLDRSDPAYFSYARDPSRLRGGSWTLFNWKEMDIGMKSYRVQYHDELLQPQAEVDFEQLLAFLLDRGAVPDAAGFSDLRSSGLWTPAGTKLLSAPTTADPVLMVAAAGDSDGILSLSMDWRPEWDKRSSDCLPPYWIRLTPRPEDRDRIRAALLGKSDAVQDTKEEIKRESGSHLDLEKPTHSHSRRPSVYSTYSTLSHLPPTSTSTAIRLRITTAGLQNATFDDPPFPNLPIHHLLPSPPQSNTDTFPASTWFASIATALSAPRGGLWSFTLPPPVLSLAHRDSVPCGILVLLDVLTDEEVPTWRTPGNAAREDLERQMSSHNKARAHIIESRMTPAERERARSERMQKEMWEFHDNMRRQALERQERESQTITDALMSQRLPLSVVAEANRKFLATCHDFSLFSLEISMHDVVEQILHIMMLDPDACQRIVNMLESWRRWVESGGMARQHFEEVRDNYVAFALASCVLEVIREAGGHPVGAAVSDLKECIRGWKKVRLG